MVLFYISRGNSFVCDPLELETQFNIICEVAISISPKSKQKQASQVSQVPSQQEVETFPEINFLAYNIVGVWPRYKWLCCLHWIIKILYICKVSSSHCRIFSIFVRCPVCDILPDIHVAARAQLKCRSYNYLSVGPSADK